MSVDDAFGFRRSDIQRFLPGNAHPLILAAQFFLPAAGAQFLRFIGYLIRSPAIYVVQFEHGHVDMLGAAGYRNQM